MRAPNFYAGSSLDRAGFRRKDDAWVAAALNDASSRFIPVWRSSYPVFNLATAPKPLAAGAEKARDWLALGGVLVFLGVFNEQAHFAIELPESFDLPQLQAGVDHPLNAQDLRALGTMLAAEDAAMLAYARGMLNWHHRHCFCGTCGAPNDSVEAGHVRRCSNPYCGTSHFPRTDPAVIMLVTSGDRCLLGHQPSWPEGMYSALAGFVEPGESLEEAVAREVFEEVGVKVGQVTYHSSQPWPFPASIMLGFYASAESTEINVDEREIADAQWFDRRWFAEQHDEAAFKLPGKQSIARRLIEDWIAGSV